MRKERKFTLGLDQFVGNEQGNLAVSLAIMILPIFAAIGSAVDVTNMYRERTDLQEAADAAALFAAREIDSSAPDDARLTTKANEVVQSQYGTEFSTISLDLQQAASTITVTLEKPYETSFMGLFGYDEIGLEVLAQASFSQPQPLPFCILATASQNTGFLKEGSGDLVAQDCGIRVNSADTIDAMRINGSGDIDVDNLCITGKLLSSGSGRFSQGTSLTEGCAPTPNPFTRTKSFASSNTNSAGLTCTHFNFSASGSRAVTVFPGVYCGNTRISGSGSVTFVQGDYHFLNGSVRISGSGNRNFGNGDYTFINAPVNLTGSARNSFGSGNFSFIDSPAEFRGSGTTSFGNGDFEFVNSDMDVVGSGSTTFGAGIRNFFDSSLNFTGSGDVSFGAGEINFATGQMNVTGSGDLTALNVNLYFQNNGSGFQFVGSGRRNMTAPTTGPFAGLLVYFDPNITTGVNTIRGSGNTLFDGVINAGGSDIVLEGSGSQINQTADLSVFVANRITRTGSGDFVFRVNPNAPFIPGELMAATPEVQVYLSK